MTIPDWSEWVTVAEAAAIRGIHRNNIWKAIRRGTLPGQKVAGRWLLRRTDVVNWQPIGNYPKGRPRRAARARQEENIDG